jgi:hypothetical protein
MKVAAGVFAAAVLFVAGVLIGTGGGRSASHAPAVVELGHAPKPASPTTAPPTTAARPTTAAPPTTATPRTTAPPVTSKPPTSPPRPPETVQRRVEYGGLDDYGGGKDSSGSGPSGSGSGR